MLIFWGKRRIDRFCLPRFQTNPSGFYQVPEVPIAAGVTPWASYEEIRAAFKRRVLETHPDKGQGYQKSWYTWGEWLVNAATVCKHVLSERIRTLG